MSDKVEAKAVVSGEVQRIREGILDYRIADGKIFPRPLTECEQLIKKWGDCVKSGVRILCDIVPTVGPLWNYSERALFIVTVYNKTSYFRLESVTVHLVSVVAQDHKADVMREPCSPDVIQIPDIRPGGHASTQNPVASWCNGAAEVPPRMGFTLLCTDTHGFPGYDLVKASAVVTYRAVPYFEGRCTAEETIVGT